MRDKNRIKRITDLLVKIWDKYPDLRFFQLLSSFNIQFNSGDLFNYEDDKFEEFLTRYLEELGDWEEIDTEGERKLRIDKIKELRQSTGCGFMECRKALDDNLGDIILAFATLSKGETR